MDVFVEQIVKRKRTPADYLKAIGIAIALVLVWGFLLVFNGYLMGMGFLLMVAAGWGAWKLLQTVNIEYEYILTNHEMDIDKITAKMRRKRMVTFDFREIEICARCDDPEHLREFSNTASLATTHDFRGGEGTAYFLDYYAGEHGKTRILFCPNERILEEAKKFAPREIFL